MRRSLALLSLSLCLALLPLESVGAQRALPTDFGGNRTTGLSGTLYFDLEVKLPVELRGFQLSLEGRSGIALFSFYLTPDTRVGKLGDPSAWTEALQLEVPLGRNLGTRISGFRPLRLAPGSYGCAIAVIGTGTHYTDGIGRDLVYEDGYLKIECGDVSESPFSGSSHAPAIWNGKLIYGEEEPRGPFLYVQDPESAVVHGYALDPKTGAPGELLDSPFLARGGSLGCPGNCQSLAADPDGDFLFAGTASGLAVLARERGGVLREVAGSPFAGTGGLLGVGAWRRGRMLRVFAAVDQTGRIDRFAVDPDTGAAVLQPSTLELGAGTDEASSFVGLQVGKRFLYAADQGTRWIHGFAIDPDGGAPTPIPGSPWLTGAPGISNLVVDARESQLAANGTSPGIYRLFSIDRRTGALGNFLAYPSAASRNEMLGFAGKRLYGGGNTPAPGHPTEIEMLEDGVVRSFLGPVSTFELRVGAVPPQGRVLYFVQHDGTRSILTTQSLEKRTGLPGPRGFSILRGGIRHPPTAALWVAR
jgi:hypothetical protein